MIDNINKIAVSGRYETGTSVEIYSSGLTFETTYTYLRSEAVSVTMADVYSCGSVSSVDRSACDHMYKWIHGLKRTATLITNSEKNRIQYFERQRRAIDRL